MTGSRTHSLPVEIGLMVFFVGTFVVVLVLTVLRWPTMSHRDGFVYLMFFINFMMTFPARVKGLQTALQVRQAS